MARSVNHHDVQDNLIKKNARLSQLSSSYRDQDLSSLSIPEQEKIIKQKLDAKKKQDEANKGKKRLHNISHYVPKKK